MKIKKIIFATGNEGKMNEIKEIMKDFTEKNEIILMSLKEAGVDAAIIEDGNTFEENALIKARAIAGLTDAVVMADDSGLEVDYLDKAPGIYSARFLGEDTSYDVKNAYILEKLEGVEDEKRSARFVCAIACVFPDGRELCVKGTIEGRIDYEIKGCNGFGYDPIFYVPEYGCTTAQMPEEKKNEVSHRGRALAAMMDELEKYNR
ncbi:MAG: XTP/dITP diphosphatase [Lachnospiraceae bacterium]|nr:XTP/dITP diphosphatase [Lachnospiraceae bacterium]